MSNEYEKLSTSLALIFITTFSFSQEDKIETAQQNAVSSMSLVDALASRIPGARKITDRRGNKNIAIRGRQSLNQRGIKFFGRLTVFYIPTLQN